MPKSNMPVIAIVAFIAIAALFFAGRSGFLGTVFGSGGLVLSATQLPYVSNNPSLGGQSWVVNIAQNGQGQSLVGTFGPDQIITSQYQSQYPFTLNMNLVRNEQQWTIQQDTNQYIRDIVIERQPGGLFVDLSSRRANCIAAHHDDPNVFFVPESGSGSVASGYTVCVYSNYLRPTGSFNGAGFNVFESDITMTVNGRDSHATISNQGATSASLTDSSGQVNALVSWAGSLVTGYTYTIPSNYKAVWSPSATQWTLIDQNQYNTYNAYYSFGLRQDLDRADADIHGLEASELDSILTNYNNLKQNALQELPLTSSGGTTAHTAGQLTSGQVILPLSQQLQIPVLTFQIRGPSYIGILQLPGQPDILSSPTTIQLASGSAGTMSVIVKNSGTATGSFAAFASCSAPVSFTGGTINMPTLAPGAQTTVYLPITASTGSSTTSQCTITIQDRNNPSAQDTVVYTIQVSGITTCTPGTLACNGNQIIQCAQDGSRYTVTQTCTGSQVCVQQGASASCQQAVGGCGDGVCSGGETTLSCPQDCSSPATAIPWGLIVLALALIGGAALVLTKKSKKSGR